MIMSFLFQAEDGIRDRTVTGVRTCALPISELRSDLKRLKRDTDSGRSTGAISAMQAIADSGTTAGGAGARSEERRVGKEWRPTGAEAHEKEEATRTANASTGRPVTGVEGEQ